MKELKFILTTLFIIISTNSFSIENPTFFVSGKGNNSDGKSWVTAYTKIETAIEKLDSLRKSEKVTKIIHSIWVECGEYKIDKPLVLYNNVQIYGGFRKSDLTIADREEINLTNSTVIYQTIKDVNVVEATGINNTRFDGFTICGANGGSGLLIENCSSNMVYANCLIEKNKSKNCGAGIRILNSNPELLNCKVSRNSVTGGEFGGGLYLDANSAGNFTHCIFVDNSTDGDMAGGIYIQSGPKSKSYFNNCSILQNRSKKDGSGIYASGKIVFDASDICSNIVESNLPGNGAYFFGDSTHVILDNGSIITGNVYGKETFKEIEGISGEKFCELKNRAKIFQSYKTSINFDEITAFDLKSIQQDLFIPDMTTGLPAPGKRVRVQLPEYAGTQIYHCIYLPVDWEAGYHYPVFVDYPGNGPYQNRFGDISGGLPESNPIGYGITGGKGAICIGLGYIDKKNGKMSEWWWGDIQADIDYCLKAVNSVCEGYGGDINNIFLTGFSRSAIGAGFIHRSNDRIADLWKGFVTYDGFDNNTATNNARYGFPEISYNYDTTACSGRSYFQRFERIARKPYLMLGTGYDQDVDSLCKIYNFEIEHLNKSHRNHNATWALRPTPERALSRAWYNHALALPSNKATVLSMPGIFADSMILQRDQPIHLWGKAPAGEHVDVHLGSNRQSTISSSDGSWELKLPQMHGDTINYKMEVFCLDKKLQFSDILIGDIWLASGQSNMAFSVKSLLENDVKSLQKDTDCKYVRSFKVSPIVGGGKIIIHKDISWQTYNKDNILDWSAVATYFARGLFKDKGIPVGIINCSQGSSTADAWISKAYYNANPLVDKEKCATSDKIEKHYKNPGVLYNSMLKGIIGYNLKGVIWYQGESNVPYSKSYFKIMSAVIDCWRNEWKSPDLPFVIAQLSCFERPDNENNTLWAQTRDQQLKVSLSVPNTAMVVTADIGDPGNIHPKDKSTVGSRMLLAAKKIAYGDKVIAEGPLYDRVKFKDGKAIVFFKNSNKGLIAKDKLKEFEICGCDGKYFPAYAEIKGSRVVLESPYVQNPVAVRYSWTNANTLSLYNIDGLPASPFRSNEDY